MADVTAVYYTANWEEPAFEAAVCEAILEELDGRPLISVSHQPMPGFGHNIAVGVQEGGLQSIYRQMLIGVQAAETEWVATVEDDSFYPPGYFDHDPAGADFWMYGSVWRLRRGDPRRYIPLGPSDGWLFARRAPFMAALEMRLRHTPGFGAAKVKRPLAESDCLFFDIGPGLSVKTGCSLHADNGKHKDGIAAEVELPIWGAARDFHRRLFENVEARTCRV